MIRRMFLAATMVALAACSHNVSVRTQAAPGFSVAGRTTFRVLQAPSPVGIVNSSAYDPMLANSITNQALRRDIVRAMEDRGYQLATDAPADLDVAFYAAAQEALDIHTYDYGYTWHGWPREYTEVTNYEKGTVIVDLVDPRTRQLLWRGQGVAAVSTDPNKYVNELDKVVNSIAKQIPTAGSR